VRKLFFGIKQKMWWLTQENFFNLCVANSLIGKILKKLRYIKTGFTLIELLVTIAILAVLATVTVVVINPGELLKQSRDATRLEDLALIKRAIGLYLADGIPLPFTTSVWGTSDETSMTQTKINGTGWVPLDFTLISFGSPISRLPIDPINKNECIFSGIVTTITGSWTQYNTCFYSFTFNMGETGLNSITLAAILESQKYRQSYSTNGTGFSVSFPTK